MQIRPPLLLALLWLFLCLSIPDAWNQSRSPDAPPRYTITAIPDLPGCDHTCLTGINNRGKIVGYAYNGVGHDVGMLGRAFVWEKGKITPLRTPGGKYSHAIGINNQDEIVGDANLNRDTLPVLWQNGGKGDPVLLSRTNGYAACINDRGILVGCEEGPYLWLKGNRTPLDFKKWKDHTYRPVTINHRGEIAGYVSGPPGIGLSDTPESSFFYQAGEFHTLETLGGFACQAMAMNESGMIAGWAENAREERRACIWKEGVAQELPAPDVEWSEASGINNQGVIVGRYVTNKQEWKTCLWKNGKALNLNTCLPAHSGWELAEVMGINDSGQIIGSGYYKDKPRSFLLTPLSK